MKVSICRLSELNAAEVERWHWFQRRTDALGSPFLTPEFASAMSEGRSDVKLAILEDHCGIAGYFAFERNRLGVGRALGYEFSDVQGVVHAPGYRWNGAELLEGCQLAIWEFDHLTADQVQCFAPQDVVLHASPVVNLTCGWESWIAGRQATSRMKKIRTHERKLVRELGAPRFDMDDRDPSHLELLMQWKSAQYRRTGRSDRFARGWFVDAFRRLFAMRTDTFAAQLSTMYVQDRPVSFHLSLRANSVMAGWFPAYDIRLIPYGLGVIHHLYVIKHASESGIRLFDFGAGEESYKRTFSDYDLTVAKGALSRRSAVAGIRRMQTAPARMATAFVLNHPPLRVAARNTLNFLGGVRARFHRR